MIVQKRPNDLIPKFLTQFNGFSKDVQTRLKLSAMLNEFDEKLNHKFISFVNLSNSRYKSVKSGNALDTILCRQKRKYNQIADDIGTDDFYHSNDIQIEKEKMEKNIHSNKTTNELKEIRDMIKQSTQDLPFRSKRMETSGNAPMKDKGGYIMHVLTKRDQLKTKSNNQKEGGVNFSQDEKNQKIINHNNDFVIGIVKEDEAFIGKEIEEYRKYLNMIKKETIAKGDIPIKLDKNMNDSKKFFLTDKIKMLNYLEEEKEKDSKKKQEDYAIDIKKVMKFTKRGKRMKWGNDYCKTSASNPILTTSSNKKEGNNLLNQMHPTDHSATQTQMRTEVSDTMNVVKSEANDCLYIDEKFYQKRNRLNKYINDEMVPLPFISNQDNPNALTAKTFGTFNKYKNMNMGMTYSNTHSNTNDDSKKGNKKNIGETFKTIYGTKAIQWKREDLDKERLDKIKAEELKHTYNFLKEVKNEPRKPQLYIDGYSYRNKANDQIKEFNQALGKNFYNKKKLNREIDHYINQKEKYNKDLEEEMKKKHEEIIRESELEAERKKAIFEEFKQRIKDEDNENNEEDDNQFDILGCEEEMPQFSNLSTQQEHDNNYNNYLDYKKKYTEEYNKKTKKDNEEENDEFECNSNGIKCHSRERSIENNEILRRRPNRNVTWNSRVAERSSVLNLNPDKVIKTLKKQLSRNVNPKTAFGELKMKKEFKIPNAASEFHINYDHLNKLY